MTDPVRRHRRERRARRLATWRERFLIVQCAYRGIYSLLWGALLVAGAYEWATGEAGFEAWAQIALAVAIVTALLVAFAAWWAHAAGKERERKNVAFERRLRERPAPHRRYVTQERDSPDVAP